MKTKPVQTLILEPRLRVRLSKEVALGPGKAELLGRVQQTGSISEAARQMGMSYMRAWQLIRTMNACFIEPLVVTERGGRQGGGAKLTEIGRRALRLYQEMERNSLRSCADSSRELQRLLQH